MISDEERREVAARMREIMRDDPHGWLDAMVVNAVTDVLGEGVAIGETVADLIDCPTCRNVAVKREDEFLCSAYGEHVDIAYMDSVDGYHARYCPNCGAEVKDD